MKTILATLVTVVVGLVALPDTAEARSYGSHSSSYTYRSGNASCGCASYTRRVIVGYDCHRRPVYRYYAVPVSHRCRSHYRPSSSCGTSHSSGYRSSGYRSSRYGHSSSYYRGHRSSSSRRGGLTIRGPHGSITIGR